MKKIYGYELILDIHNCSPDTFNRKSIREYFKILCEKIDMKRAKLVFWDDHGVAPEECQTEPHLKGTTAVQFIMTSNITIHTLDILKSVHLNIFSCKKFNLKLAEEFSANWFKGEVVNSMKVKRY